jgi:hypothetical protein
MNQLKVIELLKRVAGNGPPPGRLRFCRITGLSSWAWEQFGLTWNQVVDQAGFTPKQFGNTGTFDRDEVVRRFIGVVRELERWPVKRELHGKRRQDPTFPSSATIDRHLGCRKRQRLEAVLEYCMRTGGCDDVATMCRETIEHEDSRSMPAPVGAEAWEGAGGVYLLQCGGRYKIGKSDVPDQRITVLKRQLPKKARLVHLIRTDDPDGVERYWHERFKAKLIKNEWFRLDRDDVTAFQRCQMM